MDKIKKFLLLLSEKERAVLSRILEHIRTGKISGYDIKPLKGYKGLFRLRKGRIRIVFLKTERGNGIINVAFRKDVYEGF